MLDPEMRACVSFATLPMIPVPGFSVLALATIMCRPLLQEVAAETVVAATSIVAATATVDIRAIMMLTDLVTRSMCRSQEKKLMLTSLLVAKCSMSSTCVRLTEYHELPTDAIPIPQDTLNTPIMIKVGKNKKSRAPLLIA